MAKKSKVGTRTDKELQELLRTWRTMIIGISSLSEDEALRCLTLEMEGAQRKDFIGRLYGRFNRLRGERELQGWLRGI